MDAVILAAGHGRRLSKIVPQHYKPLMVVNGSAIVVTAAEQAVRAKVTRVIIVVSPDNARPIADLLQYVNLREGQRLSMVVQPTATGPGDALLRGLEAGKADKTLVLMGDNVTPNYDLDRLIGMGPPRCSVGYQRLEPTTANERFTRKRPDGTWTEKQPIEDRDLWEDSQGQYIMGWIGPLIIDSAKARELFTRVGRTSSSIEVGIGPYIDAIAPSAELVQVSTIDIGTPDDVNSADDPGLMFSYINNEGQTIEHRRGV